MGIEASKCVTRRTLVSESIQNHRSLYQQAEVPDWKLEGSYQELKIPARSHLVPLFVDEETRSKLTMENEGPNGEGKVLLAHLYFDQLSIPAKCERFFGMLSSLYVTNFGLRSERVLSN